MADTTKTIKIELSGESVKFEKAFTAAGKATEGLTKKLEKLSEAEMDAAHGEALKLNSAFEAGSSRAGQFADSIGKVSTTLARSASAFGLPIGPLKLLDDVADVAELGLNNLSKAAVGFNAASIGVAGAGAAIGASIGTVLRNFTPLGDWLDKVAVKLTSLGEVEAAARKASGEAYAALQEKRQAFLTGSEAEIATFFKQKTAAETLKEASKLLGFEVKDLAQAERVLAIAEKNSEAGQKRLAAEREKAAEATKKAAAEFQGLVDQLSGTSAQEEVDKLGAAFNRLGVGGVADLEALRQKLEQLQKQGAKITDKGLLGVLRGGKLEIPKLVEGDLGLETPEMDPAILAQSQASFNAIALAANAAGLSTREIDDALKAAGASGGQLEVALAAIPVTFGATFKTALAGLPQVILGAIQGGGDIGGAVGAHLGGTIGEGLGKDLSKKLTGVLGKGFADALGSLAGPLGSLLGGFLGKAFGALGGLFGDKTIMKVNDLRDAFLSAQGGWQQLQQTLAKGTDEDLVKQIFDAKTVDEFNAAVEKVKAVLATLNQGVDPVVIPVTYDVEGSPTSAPNLPPEIPSFQGGTFGFVNFGDESLALLHGWEAVVPKEAGGYAGLEGGTVINIEAPIVANPLQTAESTRQMNTHIVKLMEREVARKLAVAVAAGKA